MAKRIVDEEMRFSVVINGNEAQKELFELEKATRTLTQTNKDLKAEKARLKALGKEESAEYKKITASIKENNAALTANKNRMKVLQDQVGVTGLTMRQLSQRATQLKLQLHNMVPGSSQYKRLEADLQAVDARMRQLRTSARSTRMSLGSIANGFNKYAALGASVIATVTGMVLSIQRLIDFNGKLSDSQADVMKTTGLTQEEVDDLTKSFGAFKTRTARIELLKLAEEAGRLGITGVKNLQDFVQVANQMKVALGDDLSEEAIREVGKMTTVYKVGMATGKDFAGSMMALGSAINEVSASGANQAGYLVDYLKRQAGIAAQTKVSAAENIGYAATFDEIGQSVEVSATAMNKVWMDMFSNAGDYAKIAGMSLKDFQNLLNTDANEAMIRFLEGLNGNNEGLTVMMEKLEDIEVGGARGVAALSALAGSTELLRQRQETSNSALEKATSLTDEYNVKNNNLAATVDKVKKTMMGWFTSGTVNNGLTWLITGFGRLIGAIDDVNTEFAKQSEASYEAARANRQLANESSALLAEYEELTRDGITPTIAGKERLEVITLQLKDRLGESVLMIDEETGAFKLNTDAVREQIKVKRLAADEEAATMASRLKGTQEEIKLLKEKQQPIQREFNLRQKHFEQVNKQDLEYIRNTSNLTAMEKQQMMERMEGYKELDQARLKLTQSNNAIYEQEQRRIDLIQKLNDLNYSENDIDLLFNTGGGPEDEEIPEGTTRIIAGNLYKYIGGKWELVKFPPPGGEPEDRAAQLRKEQEALRKVTEENNKLRASLIEDSFKRELALEDANHEAKLAQIREQMATEAEIKAADPATRELLLARNRALNEQVEYEESLHQHRVGTILQKGIQDRATQEQEAFDRETVIRATAHNLEMAALGNDEEAKARLHEKYLREEEERQRQHLEKLIAQMKEILAAVDFEGIDMELLPKEERQKLLDWIDETNLKLSELLGKLGKAKGPEAERIDGDVDVLGFTIDQWEETLDNLDTTAGKLELAQMGVSSLMNAWGQYSSFMAARERQDYANFEANQRKKEESLKQNLDRGYINQRQYNAAVDAMEKEARKKRAEMEYKQAKREKEMAIAGIALNGAVAISKALAQGGFVLGVPWAAIIGGLTAIQLGLAMAMPLPAKGYEKGKYPVQREQDGKMFNAKYGGPTRSGMVNEPTLFLAGERGPEMVIDDDAYRKMDPAVKDSIYRELGRLGRVPGYEGGYYPSPQLAPAAGPSGSGNDEVLLRVVDRAITVLERMEANGVQAHLVRSLETAKQIDDDIKDYHKLRNANRR